MFKTIPNTCDGIVWGKQMTGFCQISRKKYFHCIVCSKTVLKKEDNGNEKSNMLSNIT